MGQYGFLVDEKRIISDRFIENLESGFLKDLKSYVDSDESLILCYRKNYINVYYRGHNIFKIEEQRKKYKWSFNYNHSRYTENREEILKKLERYGFELKGNILVKDLMGMNSNEGFKWVEIGSLLKGLIDDFMNIAKKKDYIEGVEKKNKSILKEKNDQQIIFKNNRDISNYYVYDMEYTQPRRSNLHETSGRFDLMAIKNEDGKYVLVFIELKSDKKAIKGKAGIEKHIKDFKKYIKVSGILKARIKEASEMLCRNNINLSKEELDKIEVRFLLVCMEKVLNDVERIRLQKYVEKEKLIEFIEIEEGNYKLN